MKHLKLYEEFNDKNAGMGRYDFLRRFLYDEIERMKSEIDPTKKEEYKKSIEETKRKMASMV